MNLKVWGSGLDTRFRVGPRAAGSCEHGDEPPGSIDRLSTSPIGIWPTELRSEWYCWKSVVKPAHCQYLFLLLSAVQIYHLDYLVRLRVLRWLLASVLFAIDNRQPTITVTRGQQPFYFKITINRGYLQVPILTSTETNKLPRGAIIIVKKNRQQKKKTVCHVNY
jgi:hypothetical protein